MTTSCSTHILVPAVGTCSHCGVAGCSACLAPAGQSGAWLHAGCAKQIAYQAAPTPVMPSPSPPVGALPPVFPVLPQTPVPAPFPVPVLVAPPRPQGDPRVFLSWLLAAVGLVYGISTLAGQPHGAGFGLSRFLFPILTAYAGWALVWGGVPCWRKLWSMAGYLMPSSREPMGRWLLCLGLSVTLALWGTVLASVWGGGLYQFWIYRQSRVPSQP